MPARLLWLVGGAALMLVAAFGPWARAFIVSVSGVDGGDGWIVVALAVVAGLCGYGYAKADKQRGRSALMILAALAGLAGLAVFGIDGRNIFGSQTSGDSDDLFAGIDLVSPGWGLIMVGVGSAIVALVSASVLVRPVSVERPSAPI